MTDRTPEDPPTSQPDVLADDRDAEEVASEELPLDPAAPTELGNAIDGATAQR